MVKVTAAAVPAKFRRNATHIPLGIGQHRSIVGRFLDLIGRPGLRQTLLKLLQSVRAYRATLPAQHHEPNRPVEPGDLELGQSPRNLLRQS